MFSSLVAVSSPYSVGSPFPSLSISALSPPSSTSATARAPSTAPYLATIFVFHLSNHICSSGLRKWVSYLSFFIHFCSSVFYTQSERIIVWIGYSFLDTSGFISHSPRLFAFYTSSGFTYLAIFNPSHMLSWCLVYVWLPFPFQRCSSGSRLYHGHCAHNCLSVRIQLSLVFWLVDIIANCSGKLHSSCQRITGPLLMTKCWMWKTLGIALGAPTI